MSVGGSGLSATSAPVGDYKKIIVKRVLKCIYWALIQSEYQVRLKSDKRQQLDQLITTFIATSDERSIQNTSREIFKILRE